MTFKIFYVRNMDFNCRNLAMETDNICRAAAIKRQMECKGFYAWIE